MRVIFLLSVLSIVKAYALSSQAQDKTSLLINHDVNTMQSDINITTDDETTPVAKRRISNGATTGTIVKAEQHSSNSFNDEAQNMKTADTSVHQLRGRNSRKPKKANHGARPCSSFMRKLKMKGYYRKLRPE